MVCEPLQAAGERGKGKKESILQLLSLQKILNLD